jgi:hypothetical protein
MTQKIQPPIAATTAIATAFKICISHRKKWALESPGDKKIKVSFSVFD